ncbi:hypothetical protein NB704_004325 [Pantoea ananatis]|nr:hypothetical protein [Pantoea ananatis]
MNLLFQLHYFIVQCILLLIRRSWFSFTHGLISLIVDQVFLPFVQDRNADTYLLCNFKGCSTAGAELTDSLDSFFLAFP